MSCSNLTIPKPITIKSLTNLFGIPYGAAGRNVAGNNHIISAIVLHCYPGTIAELVNEMKCRTRSSVISGSYENSFHLGIGAAAGSGGFQQFVEDNNISWTFGTYKNSTYATVPPPNIAINWPVLQGEFGINTTPDVYTIDIALAIGEITAASSLSGCHTCPTASGLQQTQHDMLVQMLAYLVQEYNIPIDQDHIQFHDLIHCAEGQECACTNIEELLSQVANFCPPCESEAMPAPIAEADDEIQYIYGVTEPCCPSSPGCLNLIPWNACFIGDLAVSGDIADYILGLTQDQVTGQYCLTRGCVHTIAPILGCGTVADPLRLDLCLFGDWVPDETAANVTNILGIDASGCLVETPAAEWVCEWSPDIVPVDTLTVDLTVSGNCDHTIQADVNVSAEANNQIEVRQDGLFVDFTCQDFINEYPHGSVTIILGQNVAGDCVHQNTLDLVNDSICLIPEDADAIPTWVLGKTDQECPVFVEPEDIVTAGLTVSDGFCVHMNYANGNINSELLLSQLPDNIFQCIPGVPPNSGAYVQDLTVNGSDCIDVTYVNRQLDIQVIVDPVIDNILECRANGLYSPLGGGITATDTDCLNLTLVGGILSGVITLAPTQGLVPNIAQCIAGQGFYVPQGAGLNVTDTNCIDLTISNGNLTATLVVNPSGDNQASCGPGGLFVPTAAGLIANDTDCVNHNLVAGVLSTTLNFAPAQGGIPNILSCLPGQGLYVPESHINVVDTTCIDMDFTGGVLQASIILDPTGDNQVQCLPAGLYVPPAAGLNAIDTDCITLNLAGDTLTSTPILAPTQGGVPNALVCLGSGLYVPEGANLGVLDTDCINLTFVDGVISAEPIISPDDCNGLECRGNGLWSNGDFGSVLPPPVTRPQIQVGTTGTPLVLDAGVSTAWQDLGPRTVVSITNPSTCNNMQVCVTVNGVSWGMTNQGGTNDALVAAGYRFILDGTPFPINTATTAQKPAPLNTGQHWPAQSIANCALDLAPGATLTFEVQPIASISNGVFSGVSSINSYAVGISGHNYS